MPESTPSPPPAGDAEKDERMLAGVQRSIESLLEGFVFATNDRVTWEAVRATLSSYLHRRWQEGDLPGANPEEAYRVEVGVGTTMSERDVADGYLVVQVTLRLHRPAEFIELVFRQRMNA